MIDNTELIHKTSFFEIIKKDDALLVNLKKNNNVLISSWLNGGLKKNISTVVNHNIEGQDYLDMLNGDFQGFQKLKFSSLGLIPNKSTGLMTSACMDNFAISSKKYEQLEVTTIATAGADKNGVKAGDVASFYEYDKNYFEHFGTINIITIINANLHDGALVTATITATEAKTSVLQDLKVESQYSNFIATGTGTDGICVISNKSSDNHIENAGKHSKLGELIAQSVRESVKEALYLQTFMSVDYQSTVLTRLSRFNITFDDFYDSSNLNNKLEYASIFYLFNKNIENVAFISSVINLIDEVQLGLMDIQNIERLLQTLILAYLNVDIKNEKIEKISDILNLLIKSINTYLFD